ncbi:MAG: SUMF1/EgtB/PvdO family nonheme iron enzyme [Opitutae bacterium]|nr:SUMF1/EgtB/PvdO family nonheme iron enzyme [Opitutae bacterium]
MKFGKEPELDNPYEPPTRWGLRGLLGLALAAAIGIGAWGWREWSANRQAAGAAPARQSARGVWELENRLQKTSALLEQSKNEPVSDERVRLLAEAVAAQSELRRARAGTESGDTRRLHELQTQLDDARGRQKNAQIAELEAESEARLGGAQRAEGIARLRRARALQREVNASGATAAVKNFSREERFDQMLQRFEAEPLNAEAQAVLTRGEAAAKAGRWAEALAAYREARELQARLNREYGRTQFSNLAAIERIDTEIASLGAAGLEAELVENLREARAAAGAGREAAAAANFQLAANAQRQINGQFAKSRFMSMERLQQIEAEQQTAEAAVEIRAVQAAAAEIAGDLRQRRVGLAQGKIRGALAQLEALGVRRPKARGIGEELRLRLGYLGLRQEELGPIQDQVYDLLLPQPGAESSALLQTEVPQALYALVMNSNPSRHVGRELPVDSVNYAEVREFCRRLGWIIGARVRLPTEEEFRRALGKTDPAAAADSWSAANSGGATHPTAGRPANAAGFHDLLGNVAEWLADAEPDAATAPRAGGSYATPAAEFAALPLERAPRTERSATTGFRVVVEVDLRAK